MVEASEHYVRFLPKELLIVHGKVFFMRDAQRAFNANVVYRPPADRTGLSEYLTGLLMGYRTYYPVTPFLWMRQRELETLTGIDAAEAKLIHRYKTKMNKADHLRGYTTLLEMVLRTCRADVMFAGRSISTHQEQQQIMNPANQ